MQREIIKVEPDPEPTYYEMTASEKFMFEILLPGRSELSLPPTPNVSPFYFPQSVTDSVKAATPPLKAFHVWYDSSGVEQLKLIVGSEYNYTPGFAIVDEWDGLESDRDGMLTRAYTLQIEKTRRILKMIELAARQDAEMLDLLSLDPELIAAENSGINPQYRFMQRKIGNWDKDD